MGRRIGEGLTDHEGEALLGVVAHEHSPPVREFLEDATNVGRVWRSRVVMGWR